MKLFRYYHFAMQKYVDSDLSCPHLYSRVVNNKNSDAGEPWLGSISPSLSDIEGKRKRYTSLIKRDCNTAFNKTIYFLEHENRDAATYNNIIEQSLLSTTKETCCEHFRLLKR